MNNLLSNEKRDDSKADDTFALLAQREVHVPKHIRNILEKLGFYGTRVLAKIDVNSLDEIENDVRDILGSDELTSSMEEWEKKDLFGPMFFKNPKAFKFLRGDVFAIKVIVEECEKMVEDILATERKKKAAESFSCAINQKIAIRPKMSERSKTKDITTSKGIFLKYFKIIPAYLTILLPFLDSEIVEVAIPSQDSVDTLRSYVLRWMSKLRINYFLESDFEIQEKFFTCKKKLSASSKCDAG